MSEAYEMGVDQGKKLGGFDGFMADLKYGTDAVLPAFAGGPSPLALAWECGLRGLPFPRRVRAVRIGEIPECGFSTNYRDQEAESGVSVLYVEGEDRTDDGTYDMFNAGDRIVVEGWLHFRTGSDGEPLLVGASKAAQ